MLDIVVVNTDHEREARASQLDDGGWDWDPNWDTEWDDEPTALYDGYISDEEGWAEMARWSRGGL